MTKKEWYEKCWEYTAYGAFGPQTFMRIPGEGGGILIWKWPSSWRYLSPEELIWFEEMEYKYGND